jgi:hypothetical protein
MSNQVEYSFKLMLSFQNVRTLNFIDFRAAMVDFWQARTQSGGHFTGALPLPFSISQNPAKNQALAALPLVAALEFMIRKHL